jgi:DNA (cytosine-5)-methyltransferase 1
MGYQQELLGPPLIAKDEDGELLANNWQRAILRADRLRPARLRAALQKIEPSTGWVTVDCGNPSIRRHSLLEIIDVDGDQAWWEQEEVDRHFAMMFDRHRRQIDALCVQRGSTTALTGFRRVRQGRQRLEVRFDGLAGCLRTPRGGSAKQVVIVIDGGEVRMRWMTPLEYARLQGAGEYVLPENTIQGLFGFGDAVCVPVIEWIDRHMLTPVLEGFRLRGSEVGQEAAPLASVR